MIDCTPLVTRISDSLKALSSYEIGSVFLSNFQIPYLRVFRISISFLSGFLHIVYQKAECGLV